MSYSRECAYVCVIKRAPSPTKVYLVRSERGAGWSQTGIHKNKDTFDVLKMNESASRRAKRAKLTQNRKTAFRFIIFIALSSFLNYPHFTQLPVGKCIPWHTYKWTRRPHASSKDLHLSQLLLSWWQVRPSSPTDPVTMLMLQWKALSSDWHDLLTDWGIS